MTNSALIAFFNENGDRVSIIVLDNNRKIFIGYPSAVIKNVSEIKMQTYGGIDMIGIPTTTGTDKTPATVWHPTQYIQAIYTTDVGYEKRLWDPQELG